MNKDKSLKKHGTKLIFLVCGNSSVGKKTFVEKLIQTQDEEIFPINKSFYNVYDFLINFPIGENKIKFPIEIRIINSK